MLLSRPAEMWSETEKWENMVSDIINNVHYEDDDSTYLNHEHGKITTLCSIFSLLKVKTRVARV